MIGIIIAMPQELEPYSKHITGEQQIHNKMFYVGQVGDKKIVICQSGIGKVSAAFATTLMIERFNPRAIISTGVSGGGEGLEPFDIVVADSVVQHDVDTSALGDPKGFVSTINKQYFTASKSINSLVLQCLQEIKRGIIACGDQFIADSARINQIKEEFNAIACDMESGAVAQVAYIAGVDWAVIRGITDKADDEAPKDFECMLKKVSKKLYNAVKKVIEKL